MKQPLINKWMFGVPGLYVFLFCSKKTESGTLPRALNNAKKHRQVCFEEDLLIGILKFQVGEISFPYLLNFWDFKFFCFGGWQFVKKKTRGTKSLIMFFFGEGQ